MGRTRIARTPEIFAYIGGGGKAGPEAARRSENVSIFGLFYSDVHIADAIL
jgi:hypothetical protein